MRTPANPNANKRRIAYIEMMDTPRLRTACRQASRARAGASRKSGGRARSGSSTTGGFPTNTVLCSNDRLAIGLPVRLLRAGLRVGRGEGCALRVASHDDHPFSRFTCPSLTTAAHDYDRGQPPSDAVRPDRSGGSSASRRKRCFRRGLCCGLPPITKFYARKIYIDARV
jgi:hypothetical protein